MARTTLALMGLALLTLTACGGANSQYTSGCNTMMKRADDMSGDERKAFCSCLTDNSDDRSDSDKRALGKAMKEAEDGQDLRRILEEMNQDGGISTGAAAAFFSTAKTCSLNSAM